MTGKEKGLMIDLTIGEVIEKLTAAASKLYDKNVTGVGFENLVQERMDGMDFIEYPLSVHHTRLWFITDNFGEINIADFEPHYKADKRRRNGFGDRIESVEVVKTMNLPDTLSIEDAKQKIIFDIAKEKHEKLLSEISDLEEKLLQKRIEAKGLEEIVKTEEHK